MRQLAIIALLLTITSGVFGQTQTIKGRVISQTYGDAKEGATIQVIGTKLGANADAEGYYEIKNVPIGRLELVCSFLQQKVYSDAQILTTAKALVYDFEMPELELDTNKSYNMRVSPFEPKNSANLGAHTMKIEDIQRAPGNADDPSRYVMTLPGVQPVRDDNSDIIIRGNAPTGLLWRLEGIDIPNPNHFARKGNTGGGISMFSAQLLGKSDFSTGAFSAEYGNALSGVFDLNFREGDMDKREYRLKFGLLGIDLATEGPIKKGHSSYLVNYRYSTLGILNDLGYRLLNKRIDNNFQDLSFSLNFKGKNQSNLKVFGIVGYSEELWDPVEDSVLYSRSYRSKRDYLTYMGTIGATYTSFLNENTLFQGTVALVGSQVIDNDDTLDVANAALMGIPNATPLPELSASRFESEDYQNSRLSTHLRITNHSIQNVSLKAGLIASAIRFKVFHEARDIDESNPENFVTLIEGQGSTGLIQPYVQASFSKGRLAINGGIHGMYLTLNGMGSIEPRLNAKLNLTDGTSVMAAYGLHGRTLPLGNYFTQVREENGSLSMPNMDLDIMKSHHFVLGMEQIFFVTRNENKVPAARLSIQLYYQSLFNIPVLPSENASFWLLNQRDGYATEALVSDGTGTNRGIDIAFQKLFSQGFFGQLSTSFYQSRFQTRVPDRSFSTKYDGGFSGNAIIGKEFQIGSGNATKKTGPALLTIAARGFYAGGLRYSPGDPGASAAAGMPVIPLDSTFAEQLDNYFRIDLRLALRKSFAKTAIQFSLDIQNVTNRRNAREELWDEVNNRFYIEKQSGLIPVFSLQFDF